MQKVMATLGSVYLRFNKLQATHKPVRYARKKSNGLTETLLFWYNLLFYFVTGHFVVDSQTPKWGWYFKFFLLWNKRVSELDRSFTVKSPIEEPLQ